MEKNMRVNRIVFSVLFTIILFVGLIVVTNIADASTAESPIRNNSFEKDLKFWKTNGSEAIVVKTDDWAAPNGGDKRLDYYSDDPYVAKTFQTISDIENGNYILSVYIANNGIFNTSYMYVESGGDKITKDLPETGDWRQIKLPVTVENREITIGFNADGQSGAWLGVDVVTLTKEENITPDPDGFIKGLDISSLTKVEDHGGIFFDQGIEKEPLEIFTDYGANYARLVIWKDPVDVDDYNNLEDTIKKAKRIKSSGMKLLLNFHYSEFWADPGRQDIPEAWRDYSFDELVQAVYDHTEETLTALEKEGIIPDMIQVGNEIRSGMLFPHGEISKNGFSNLSMLINSGIQAVRDAEGGKNIDVMLHLDEGGDNEAYQWWFDGVTSEGVIDFQVIGASYYPYWHGTLKDLEHNLNDISKRYDKDVIVVETSYGFTLDDADGHSNQFNASSEKIAGYPATAEGQAKFLYDLLEIIKNVPNEHGKGFFYWEPAWLGVEGAGWKSGEGNSWENQALFDFEGNALEALNIYTDDYVAEEPEPRPADPEPEKDPTLKDLMLYSLNKPTTASSSAGNGVEKPNAPQYAVDGNDYTSWGTDEGIGAWWQVDLEEDLPVERILFQFWDGIEQIRIEISTDGEKYTDLGLFDIDQSKMNIALSDEMVGRYLKVTITKATSNWVGFMRFDAYGLAESVDKDQIAPETKVTIKGKLVDGSYMDQVKLDFTAIDDDSGVAKTEYSFDNGIIWHTFKDEFTFNEIGEHSILYRSIDMAENVEETKRLTFSIQIESNEDISKIPAYPEENKIETEEGVKDKKNEEVKGTLLPRTFTGTYNFIVIGMSFFMIGIVIYLMQYRKKNLSNNK